MWRKLWNWLKGIWTWILDLFRPPESLGESPPEPRTLTEAGYERIMRRLLDQLHADFDQQALQEFLKDDRISETDLVEWLQRAGVRWMREGGSQRQDRLGQLGRQLQGDLAKTARGLYEHFKGSPAETGTGSPPTTTPDPARPLSVWDTPVADTPPETDHSPQDQTAAAAEIDHQEIERLFQQGLALAGSDGQSPATGHRRQEAITYWDMAIAMDDTQARLWANRGAALVDLNLHEQALISLNKALDLQSDEAMAWVKRGEALLELGRVEQALPDLEQAVQIDPTSVEAWYFQGRALAQLQRWEAAIQCFDRALQLQPILHLAWIERGKAALQSHYADLSATGQFHQNPPLNQRGRDGAIASFRAGQRYCTRQDHPLKWQDLQQQIQDLSRSSLG